MMQKFKIYSILFLVLMIPLSYFVLIKFTYSEGKRVGNLVKLSKTGGPFSTWEGTLDEGPGDELKTQFSIADDELADQMFKYEGRRIALYYKQRLFSFPYQSPYMLYKWTPLERTINKKAELDGSTVSEDSRTHGDEVSDNSDLNRANVTGKRNKHAKNLSQFDSKIARQVSLFSFCTLLGTLYKNQALYDQVKEFVKNENPYLFKMYKQCNQ